MSTKRSNSVKSSHEPEVPPALDSTMVTNVQEEDISNSSSAMLLAEPAQLGQTSSAGYHIPRRTSSEDSAGIGTLSPVMNPPTVNPGPMILTRVNVDSITDISKMDELVTKLRSKYAGDFSSCRVFDYVLKPASTDLMVEIHGFTKAVDNHGLPDREFYTLTLDELLPFLEYRERSARSQYCGPHSILRPPRSRLLR